MYCASRGCVPAKGRGIVNTETGFATTPLERQVVDSEPSRFRWWVLAFLFLSILINLLDRQVLSIVAPVLRDTFGMSATQYGQIIFGFMLGMALMQIPAGIFLDRWGARLGLTVMSCWWSAANLVHAFARSVPQFFALRFLLGMAECGNYSGGLKVIAQWFPSCERALAAGIFNSGTLVGSIVAVPLVTFLTLRFGWQVAFIVPSTLGFLWAAVWATVYRSPQSGAADINPNAKRGGAGALGQLFRMRQTWAVLAIRGLAGPVSQFYWFWLPEYLKRERQLSLETIGLLAWIPYLVGGLGNLGGGWFSSHLIQRGWIVDRARKCAFLVAVVLTATSGLVPVLPSVAAAIVLICVAVLGINAFAATFMGMLTDIFPEQYVARVAGITGLGDSGMSMFLMLATGMVVDRFSYLPIFISAACVPAFAFVLVLTVIRRIERCHP